CTWRDRRVDRDPRTESGEPRSRFGGGRRTVGADQPQVRTARCDPGGAHMTRFTLVRSQRLLEVNGPRLLRRAMLVAVPTLAVCPESPHSMSGDYGADTA